MLTRIGSVEVWRILESIEAYVAPQEFFHEISDADLEFLRGYAPRQLCPESGRILLPIQGFLLKTPQHVILVDACIGNDKTYPAFEPWQRRKGARFMAGLRAAGVEPEGVDYVLCTHLHVDHVGWNTRLKDGRWAPTFPNARYLMQATDNAHFSALAGPVYNESVLPVIEAGQVEFVGPDHMLGDFVSLIPTPGHTPGHVSILIQDAGTEVVITGDALHSTVQCTCPNWNFRHDVDKPLAEASRRRLLGRAASEGQRVLGSHFPLPSIGHVRAKGDAFDWNDL